MADRKGVKRADRLLSIRLVGGGELPAGGLDVRAEVLPEGVMNFVLGEDCLKLFDS